MQNKVRNCFLSYHHGRDQKYLYKLSNFFGGMKVADYSMKEDIGDYTDDTIYKKIRDKMRTCSVTIVLVGERTGHRKWVDWEIWASLRAYTHSYDPYKSFKPNGLLAIYLPFPDHSVPERLKDNLYTKYAVKMKWKNLEGEFEAKMNEAYWRRTNHLNRIDNSRERQDRNFTDFLGFKF